MCTFTLVILSNPEQIIFMSNKSNFYPKKVYVSGYRWGSFNSFVERMIKAHIYTVASLLFLMERHVKNLFN